MADSDTVFTRSLSPSSPLSVCSSVNVRTSGVGQEEYWWRSFSFFRRPGHVRHNTDPVTYDLGETPALVRYEEDSFDPFFFFLVLLLVLVSRFFIYLPPSHTELDVIRYGIEERNNLLTSLLLFFLSFPFSRFFFNYFLLFFICSCSLSHRIGCDEIWNRAQKPLTYLIIALFPPLFLHFLRSFL